MKPLVRTLHLALSLAIIGASSSGLTACKRTPPSDSSSVTPDPCLKSSPPKQLDMVNRSLHDGFRHFLRDDCPVVGDAEVLQQTFTMVATKPLSTTAGWEAFNSAVFVAGYGVARDGRTYTLIPIGAPLPVGAAWVVPSLLQVPRAASMPEDCLEIRPKQRLHLVDKSVDDLLRYFLRDDCQRMITGDASALKSTLTVVTDKPLNSQEAWQAFNTALHASGYTILKNDRYYKLVHATE
jgi:hypothetical protein